MGREWINLNNIGTLEVEIVLVTFDVPILFVCKNSADRRFLVLCLDEEEGKYAIAEQSINNLILMLDNKKTMEYVFRSAKNNVIFLSEYDFDSQEFIFIEHDAKTIDKELLPKEGACFELSNEKIIRYKETLRGIIPVCSKEETRYRVIKLNDYQVKKQPMISTEYSENKIVEADVGRNSVINQHKLLKNHLIA